MRWFSAHHHEQLVLDLFPFVKTNWFENEQGDRDDAQGITALQTNRKKHKKVNILAKKTNWERGEVKKGF